MRLVRIAIFVVCSLFAVELWAEQCEIRVDHANARREADSSADVIAVLSKGEVRPVVDDVPYWYEIELRNGRKAWVAKSLCTLVLNEEEEENAADEIGQPLSELYPLPAFGPSVSIPSCTPVTLNVNWSVCPAEGSSESGGQAKNWRTNQKKNRVTAACTFSSLTPAQVLRLKPLPGSVRTLPAADERATYLQSLEGTPVIVEGYLSMVKAAGKESTNCYSASRKDFHFEILPSDQGDPKIRRDEIIITEITPWFSEVISGWTTANLGQFASYRNGYSGSMQRSPARVRVYGWLFYDDPHSGDASVGTWRGTAWEIHPVTRIEVFENGNWREIR
ncbi:MAG TPA: SH3 domain-containing protein [Terriglobia bacterium]|nr:SH3 domain-containing protein [Terriglobia bacterium]